MRSKCNAKDSGSPFYLNCELQQIELLRDAGDVQLVRSQRHRGETSLTLTYWLKKKGARIDVAPHVAARLVAIGAAKLIERTVSDV